MKRRFSDQRSRKSTEKTRASLCGGRTESTLSFCLSDSLSASSLHSDSPSPSPVLPFTLVCLLDVTLSCSFLSLWTAFLTSPQSHVARTDSSPSLSLGHRSHFPLRSIRLHFRNYSRHSWGRKREEGEARKKGAAMTSASSKTAAVLPDFCQ